MEEIVGSEGVRFPIRLGDTIPGYVAATKLIVNINAIKQVRNSCCSNEDACCICHVRNLTSSFQMVRYSLKEVCCLMLESDACLLRCSLPARQHGIHTLCTNPDEG